MLPAMRMGGAEKIALSFLKELKEYFDVTVCLNNKEGELLCELPEDLSCVEDPILSFKEIVSQDLHHLQLDALLKDLRYYLRVKRGRDKESDYRYLISRTPPVAGHYDIAIAYVANVSTQLFNLADRVQANIKIAWVHGETNELKDSALFERIYSKLDKIYCVSEISRKHFVEKYPSCVSITDVYYNPINRAEIIENSRQSVELPYNDEYINLLSVGRLSPEKGFDMIPQVLCILNGKGYRVRWYLIGDGPLRASLENSVKESGIEGSFFMLGTRTNPYPYMAACDIYVQPSYEEGYSTTICEAGILGKAIVGTKTSGGIYEQVEDGISAVLTEPNPEALAGAIERLLTDVALKNKLETKMREKDFTHPNEIQKLLNFAAKGESFDAGANS